MFDLKTIRENAAFYDNGWVRRGLGAQTPAIIEMDEKKRKVQTELQTLQADRNDASKQIGLLKSKGQDASDIMARVADYKEKIQKLEEEEKALSTKLDDVLSRLPNIPDASVPNGTDEKGNVELRRVGEPRRLNHVKDHVDLGEGLGMMDFESAAKMSGSRFVILKSGLARLERALGQFMLDTHTMEHGYTEMSVPLLVNSNAMFGTGQLPKFEEDLFKVAQYATDAVYPLDSHDEFQRDLSEQRGGVGIHSGDQDGKLKSYKIKSPRYLVPTSEVSLTNTVLDTILDLADLPLRLTSLTPCFRSEAGAAGKDTRGMIRQHQFYKVEMVSITDADSSMDELERMTSCAETILKKLDLAFRTIVLCTGDMGFSAKRTHDLEVWLPAQNTYREISSCSNCGDFQARRMMARYKGANDKNTKYVHTLNGSGVAVGRALIAVLENYQQPDGSVAVPDVLQKYMGGMKKIEGLAKAVSGKATNA